MSGLPSRTPLSEALADGHDVSLAVLEPRGLGTTPSCDAVLHLDPRHVAFLEDHPPGLELGHLRLDVADLPERLAGLRRARVRGLLQHGFALHASIAHVAAVLLPALDRERP